MITDWISVSDRLPEKVGNYFSESVLVTNGFDVFVAWYDYFSDRWDSENDVIDYKTPTHWMYLPEPPEVNE